MVGNYSFHRSLGRICSKTGEATRAYRDTVGLPNRVRMVPSDLCLLDYRFVCSCPIGAVPWLLFALAHLQPPWKR